MSINPGAGSPFALAPSLLQMNLHHPMRDTIQPGIELSRLGFFIADWWGIQRLAHIQQNSGAHASYMEAVGTRKAHVLGVAAKARKMMGRMREPWTNGVDSLFDEWRRADETQPGYSERRWNEAVILAELAGALHDLPHIMLDHHWGDIYGIEVPHDANEPRFMRIWATLGPWFDRLVARGAMSGEERTSLNTLVEPGGEMFEEIHAIVLSKLPPRRVPRYPWVGELVNRYADMADYVPRDAYNSGAKAYSHDDRFEAALDVTSSTHPRFPERVFLHTTRRNGRRGEVMTSLKALLEHRLDLFNVLYGHHAVLAECGMAAKALELFRDHLNDALGEAEGEFVRRETLLRHGDSSILLFFAYINEDAGQRALCGTPEARPEALARLDAIAKLGWGAAYRDLFKVGAITDTQWAAHSLRNKYGSSAARSALETQIAAAAGRAIERRIDPNDIVLRIVPPGNKSKDLEKFLIGEGDEIMTLAESRYAAMFRELMAAHLEAWRDWLFVDASLDSDAVAALTAALEQITQAHWTAAR